MRPALAPTPAEFVPGAGIDPAYCSFAFTKNGYTHDVLYCIIFISPEDGFVEHRNKLLIYLDKECVC